MIYAISGLKRTGKDTVARFVHELTGAKHYALAKPIKHSLYVSLVNMRNITWEDMNGDTDYDREQDLMLTTPELRSILRRAINENHNKLNFEQWELTKMFSIIDSLRSHDRMTFVDCFKYGFMRMLGRTDAMKEIESRYKWSVRRLMQCLGTDIVVKVRRDYWLEFMDTEMFDDDFIISDIRQDHEMDYFRKKSAKIIFVVRDGVVGNDSHITERGLEPELGDFIIKNDGTLQDLHDKVERIVNQ